MIKRLFFNSRPVNTESTNISKNQPKIEQEKSTITERVATPASDKQKKWLKWSFVKILNELTKKETNVNAILINLKGFINETNQLWYELNHDDPEEMMNAVGYRKFMNERIEFFLKLLQLDQQEVLLNKLSSLEMSRMRNVIDFAVERACYSEYLQNNPEIISLIAKLNFSIDILTNSIEERLGLEPHPIIEYTETINSAFQLSQEEINGLESIGLKFQFILSEQEMHKLHSKKECSIL